MRVSHEDTKNTKPNTVWVVLGVLGVFVALLSGCPHKPPEEKPPPIEPRPEPVEVPREVLEHDLEATVMENYSHLTLGNFGAFRDGLASDQSITLIGVMPEDVVVGRRPRDAARDRRLYPMLGPTLLAKNLEVHTAEDGSVGWMFDEMSYRVPYGGRTASIPIRNTGLFVRDFDRWVLALEHQSYAVSIDDLRGMAAAGTLEPPRRFDNLTQAAPSRELITLVDRLHNAGASPASVPVRADEGTLLLLPDRDHELRGAAAQDAPTLSSIFGPSTKVTVRDARVGVAKNGAVAWVAANLVVRTMVNDAPTDIGLRGSYVFVKGAETWELAQMHLSAPVTERELSRRTFGTP